MNNLKSGNTKSCGCGRARGSANGNYKHGDVTDYRPSKEYRTWKGMIRRCTVPSASNFEIYGARGVFVCDEWMESFPAFLEHVGRAPSAKHSIDRINNNRGYEPGNVRWATASQQVRNSRKVSGSFAGQYIGVLAREHEINYNTLKTRLRSGMPLDEALKKPVRRGNFKGRPRRGSAG